MCSTGTNMENMVPRTNFQVKVPLPSLFSWVLGFSDTLTQAVQCLVELLQIYVEGAMLSARMK
jgi:hypothetical protein